MNQSVGTATLDFPTREAVLDWYVVLQLLVLLIEGAGPAKDVEADVLHDRFVDAVLFADVGAHKVREARSARGHRPRRKLGVPGHEAAEPAVAKRVDDGVLPRDALERAYGRGRLLKVAEHHRRDFAVHPKGGEERHEEAPDALREPQPVAEVVEAVPRAREQVVLPLQLRLRRANHLFPRERQGVIHRRLCTPTKDGVPSGAGAVRDGLAVPPPDAAAAGVCEERNALARATDERVCSRRRHPRLNLKLSHRPCLRLLEKRVAAAAPANRAPRHRLLRRQQQRIHDPPVRSYATALPLQRRRHRLRLRVVVQLYRHHVTFSRHLPRRQPRFSLVLLATLTLDLLLPKLLDLFLAARNRVIQHVELQLQELLLLAEALQKGGQA
mmetsp:Transcript_28784/g.94065  ORF Transcript_28784/g.94065 Transcript_28784/m.94065 type:complete len:384 (+) Transcript_28784:19-1170(+)